MPVILFEDATVADLEPLALTRPAFDLRCGAQTLAQRQHRFCGAPTAAAFVRPALAALCRRAHPDWIVNPTEVDGTVTWVNARWLPLGALRLESTSPEIGLVGEEIAYVRQAANHLPLDNAGVQELLAEAKLTLPQRQAGGRMMQYAWDLIESNADALREDADVWRQNAELGPISAATVVGPKADFIFHPSARIEPHVLVDTSHGPVLVDRGAVVQAFTRLEGPCYVGLETQVLAARIRNGSIGPQCRIGGEVEASIVQGYTNKYHDGFLGHSYLGEWVNFGAGTHTSDLRTDYGPISMPINGRTVATGLIKIGAYVGDHTRTSIATLLNTGTMIGPFGLLIASGSLLPRLIPPFARYGYGRIQERTDLREMFAAAATAVARRGQEWQETDADFYLSLFDETAEARRKIIRDNDQRRLRRVV